MLDSSERFGEDVSGLRGCGNMTYVDLYTVNRVNVVMSCIDMFCTRMLYIVLDIVKSRCRVGIYNGGSSGMDRNGGHQFP